MEWTRTNGTVDVDCVWMWIVCGYGGLWIIHTDAMVVRRWPVVSAKTGVSVVSTDARQNSCY